MQVQPSSIVVSDNVRYDIICYVILSFRKPSIEALSLAKQNVERYYAVVGYLENFPQFLEVLQTTLPQFFSNVTQFYSK